MQHHEAGSLPQTFGTREVAEALGRSERTIRRWIRSGVLPDRRPAGSHYRLLAEDVGRILNARAEVQR